MTDTVTTLQYGASCQLKVPTGWAVATGRSTTMSTSAATATRVGKRAVFNLALQVAEEQIRPGLVLLGNVAHSLHPVAGQGFNLALRDTMTLARNIRESLQLGRIVAGR